MIDEDDPDGFGERPQSGFSVAGDSSIAFYRFVLSAYNYRCAISGIEFPPQDGILHPQLDVVPIHPRELSGSLEIGNALVLQSSLASAFGEGLITAADDYSVIVPRPDALSPEQAQLVVAGRALFLPDDPLFKPALKHLHFHRVVIARYLR